MVGILNNAYSMHCFRHTAILIPSLHGLRKERLAWDHDSHFKTDTRKEKEGLHFLSLAVKASETNNPVTTDSSNTVFTRSRMAKFLFKLH